MYFWMNGACHEPKYSHSRIVLAKMMGFITIIDDFIDTHATTEESMKLGEAILRSDYPHVLKYFACSPLLCHQIYISSLNVYLALLFGLT
jgi:hypothetical protein